MRNCANCACCFNDNNTYYCMDDDAKIVDKNSCCTDWKPQESNENDLKYNKAEKCRNCKYICKCCRHGDNFNACSGCENLHDEFIPAEFIIYCPLTGEKII